MEDITAVLLDTISIQQYIFSSNKLKLNKGASNIVSGIYEGILKESLESVLSHKVDLNAWMNKPREMLIKNADTDFEVGYIGGGNALLFFTDYNKAKAFVKEWTVNLLVNAPGVRVAAAISKFDINNFQSELKKLFDQLEANKGEFITQTTLPKYGITADCRISGLTGDIYGGDLKNEDSNQKNYISSVVMAKLANAESQDDYAVLGIDKNFYTFTNNINKLGQRDENSYIAIVCIDGNSIGQLFKECQNLAKIRTLSQRLHSVINDAYIEFIEYVVSNMDYFMDGKNGLKIRKEENKHILPVRQILNAGDDIVFVTDGRLGIHFAEKYIQIMSKYSLTERNKLSACAGVAIIKTKYPFYRGYRLAEQLCTNAKKQAHMHEGTSWLDFYVSSGGFSGSLEEIRDSQYKIEDGCLNFGPYLISEIDRENEKKIFHLKKGIKIFLDREKWPRSKVNELRTYLTLGKEPSKIFIREMELRDSKLYGFSEYDYSKDGWVNGMTPYADMIELLDFYPEYFL